MDHSVTEKAREQRRGGHTLEGERIPGRGWEGGRSTKIGPTMALMSWGYILERSRPSCPLEPRPEPSSGCSPWSYLLSSHLWVIFSPQVAPGCELPTWLPTLFLPPPAYVTLGRSPLPLVPGDGWQAGGSRAWSAWHGCTPHATQ